MKNFGVFPVKIILLLKVMKIQVYFVDIMLTDIRR